MCCDLKDDQSQLDEVCEEEWFRQRKQHVQRPGGVQEFDKFKDPKEIQDS